MSQTSKFYCPSPVPSRPSPSSSPIPTLPKGKVKLIKENK